MDTSLKQAWVAALKSGRFLQARETLKGPIVNPTEGGLALQVGFCCLGVLCKVLEENPRLRPEGLMIQEGDAKLEVAFPGECGTSEYEMNELPKSLQLALGLGGEITRLMSMNDGSDGVRPHTFPEIAAYIEENV